MRYSTTLLATALAAAAPSLQAAQTYGGNAVIVNQCDYPLHLWSVDETHYPADGDYKVVPAKSNWTEPLRVPNKGCNCGVSIKLAKGTSLSGPLLQFEYTLAEASSLSSMFMSYDISFVDCAKAQPSIAAIDGYDFFSGANCPAWDEGISITGTGSSCPSMDCKAGEFCYLDAYFEPEPKKLLGVQPVRQCANGDLSSDIVLVTCTSNGSSGGSSNPLPVSSSQAVASSSPSPSPSPSSSSSSSPSPSPSSSSAPSSYSAVETSSSAAPSVVAAEFAPISSSISSSATPTPEITSAPAITAAVKTEVVIVTAFSTVFVDTSGTRINQDGTKYHGRRFAA